MQIKKKKTNFVIQAKARQLAETKQRNILKQEANKTNPKRKDQKLKWEAKIESTLTPKH